MEGYPYGGVEGAQAAQLRISSLFRPQVKITHRAVEDSIGRTTISYKSYKKNVHLVVSSWGCDIWSACCDVKHEPDDPLSTAIGIHQPLVA